MIGGGAASGGLKYGIVEWAIIVAARHALLSVLQYFYTIFVHNISTRTHMHTHLINLVKFVGCVVCSEEKMQRLLTKTRFIN